MKNGWQKKTLSEICQIKPPKSEARSRLSNTDLVSFVPMEDLGINQKYFIPTQVKPLSEVSGSYTYFAENDVLLAKITPCFENGKLGIAANLTNGIGFGSSEYIVFRPGPLVNKEWLYYFLSRDVFREEGVERMNGAVGHKRISKEFIDSYQIPIPPISEQERIVEILDEAFECIALAMANTEKNLKNARAIFESQLNVLFSKHGDGWEKKTLDEVLQRTETVNPLSAPEIEFEYIDVSCVSNLTFKIEETQRLKGKDAPSRARRLVKTNDVLFATVRPTLQRIAIVPENLSNQVCSTGYFIMRPKAGIDHRFVFYFLFTESFMRHMEMLQKGASYPAVTDSEVRSQIIPVPKLSEQRRIVEQLESLSNETRRLESIYLRKLTALTGLKKSLLQQAFTSNLKGSP